jgi:hypothetical protein
MDNIIDNKNIIYKFTLTSKMLGYYCDGRDCKQVPIKDIEKVGSAGLYKGVTVGRNPDCWGVCKYLILGTNSTVKLENSPNIIKTSNNHSYIKNIFILILSMIIIIILSIIILKLK